ncbi:Tautomerase/MIF superfamily [Absidia repens]|uniref:L-dopachrome isomerase n=1 Tax=Absidia repens TaxID=90262 RepID=A0A1X2IQV9_9FUNG|nr:Tautomerase/MIF superfamily [Absidia repens]
MPILEVSSQKAPKDLAAFSKRLSTVFAEHVGKPEALCLVTFTKVDELLFGGNNEPGFLVKVGSIGNVAEERNIKLTKAISAEIQAELGINNDRGFFLFSDYPAAHIGYKDTVFSTILK